MLSCRTLRAFVLLGVALAPLSGRASEPPPTPAPNQTSSSQPVVRPTVTVTGTAPTLPTVDVVDGADALVSGLAGDVGELLRGLPGLDLGRMGGHGLEPRVRCLLALG